MSRGAGERPAPVDAEDAAREVRRDQPQKADHTHRADRRRRHEAAREQDDAGERDRIDAQPSGRVAAQGKCVEPPRLDHQEGEARREGDQGEGVRGPVGVRQVTQQAAEDHVLVDARAQQDEGLDGGEKRAGHRAREDEPFGVDDASVRGEGVDEHESQHPAPEAQAE